MEKYEIIIEEIRDRVRQYEADKQAMSEEIRSLTEKKAAAEAARQAAANSGDSEKYAEAARNVDFCAARISALRSKCDEGAISYDESVAYNERLTKAYTDYVTPLYLELDELSKPALQIIEKLKKIDNDTCVLNYIKPTCKKEGKSSLFSSLVTFSVPRTLCDSFDRFYDAFTSMREDNQ